MNRNMYFKNKLQIISMLNLIGESYGKSICQNET